ncbi:VCBS domain-containing protein, partial [Falsiroseomonas sp.]|uniref:VCBS domain-containing protein n=1 Tax=Falsiroseomonas sp. TaxID=2870721 RepID=UPI003F6E8D9A
MTIINRNRQADTLAGASTADSLLGAEGEDVLRGRSRADAARIGQENDAARYAALAAGTMVTLPEGGEATEAAGDRFIAIADGMDGSGAEASGDAGTASLPAGSADPQFASLDAGTPQREAVADQAEGSFGHGREGRAAPSAEPAQVTGNGPGGETATGSATIPGGGVANPLELGEIAEPPRGGGAAEDPEGASGAFVVATSRTASAAGAELGREASGDTPPQIGAILGGLIAERLQGGGNAAAGTPDDGGFVSGRDSSQTAAPAAGMAAGADTPTRIGTLLGELIAGPQPGRSEILLSTLRAEAVDDGTAPIGGGSSGGISTGTITEDSVDVIGGALPPGAAGPGGAGYLMPASLDGVYGSFTFDPSTGAWTYRLDNTRAATQELPAGQLAQDVLPVTTADGGTTLSITIAVTGANDAARIATLAVGTVREGSSLTLTGDANVADIDRAEAAFRMPDSLAGTYGNFTFDAATGVWTYALDNSLGATRALSNGVTVFDTLRLVSVDGSAEQILVVTVRGTGSAARVTGSATGSVVEDGSATVTGDLEIIPADSGESRFAVPESLAGTYGTFVFDTTTGAWSYALDNTRAATQALTDGETATETLTVRTEFGTGGQAITVTVTGANDAAGLGGSVSGTLTEDSSDTISGDLDIADVDAGEAVFRTPASLAGTYGTFAFNATTGAWSYALDNTRPATQALTDGQIVTDSLTVTSADGSASQAITVTVTGANDAASISGSASGTLTEGSTDTISGDLDIADVDAGEAVFRTPASLAGTYGNFAFDAATGAWSYALDNTRPATQALTDGQIVTDSLTVTSADGTASQAITVSVTGANDAASISGSASGAITEGSGTSVTGDLDVADVDAGEAVFRTPASLAGTYGTFAFDAATGAWSYALDNTRPATQALTDGQIVTDSLTVTSADGTASQAITVTVTGANDAASISGSASGAITEGSGTSVTGDLDVADVDAGEAVFRTPASLAGT